MIPFFHIYDLYYWCHLTRKKNPKIMHLKWWKRFTSERLLSIFFSLLQPLWKFGSYILFVNNWMLCYELKKIKPSKRCIVMYQYVYSLTSYMTFFFFMAISLERKYWCFFSYFYFTLKKISIDGQMIFENWIHCTTMISTFCNRHCNATTQPIEWFKKTFIFRYLLERFSLRKCVQSVLIFFLIWFMCVA